MDRILIALPNDTLGGAEQYLKMIAYAFLTEGAEVYVFFLKKGVSGGWNNIKCDSLKLHFTNAETEIQGILPLVLTVQKYKNLKFDYIFTSHVNLTSLIGMLLRLKLLKKEKFIARESTSIFKRFSGSKLAMFKFLYHLGYTRSIDLLICQTEFMKDQLISNLPRLAKTLDIRVIPNPVDMKSMKQKGKIAGKADLSRFGRYIVSAGRLIPEKGFDVLVRSFSLVKKEFNSINLVILGTGQDRTKLDALIKDLDLEHAVFFEGFVQNVYPYFNKAEACVVSSRIEGFPNVLLQMMSQNHKVISTRCAGGIDDMAGLFVARPDDVNSLAYELLRALNSDTIGNRKQFDDILADRDIQKFMRDLKKI